MSLAATARTFIRPRMVPWALKLRAVTIDEPEFLAEDLQRALRECGGWILDCEPDGDGILNLLFEFERRDCCEIYSILVACGLELSASTHRSLAMLCQCNGFRPRGEDDEIVNAHLEVELFAPHPLRVMRSLRAR